jgi:nitroreductase
MSSARGRQLIEAAPAAIRPPLWSAARRLKSMMSSLRDWSRYPPTWLLVRSPNLAREMRAVAAGKAAFTSRTGGQLRADYVLRRNTHRLEKGLISRPRRQVFATEYIEETVERFLLGIGCCPEGVEAGSELAWCRDVLEAYFRIGGHAPEIDRARSRFERADLGDPGESTLTPFLRDLEGGPPVEYDALLRLATQRRSVRWFESRPVPRDLIDAAVAVAAQAPSACNRQPFEFRVFDTPERVHEVASAPGGAAGFLENFPAVVAVVGRLDAFFSDRDRHLIYIDGSLAAMSFMLALETLGLASCAINTPGTESAEEQLVRVLGLARHERPVMLIALGFPDRTGLVPRSQKKPLSQLRTFES